MPYTISPPCPEGKTRITWQFGTEEIKTYEEGDDYRNVRISNVPCPTYDILVYYNASLGTTSDRGFPANYWLWQPPNKAAILLSSVKAIPSLTPDDFIPLYSFAPGGTGEIIGWRVSVKSPVYGTGNCLYTVSGDDYTADAEYDYFIPGSVSNVEVQVLNTRNDVCSYNQLEIYKNGSLVLVDTGCGRLAVYHNCLLEQCPPNTCQVECGNTICCYNSNGISVLNFPKP